MNRVIDAVDNPEFDTFRFCASIRSTYFFFILYRSRQPVAMLMYTTLNAGGGSHPTNIGYVLHSRGCFAVGPLAVVVW